MSEQVLTEGWLIIRASHYRHYFRNGCSLCQAARLVEGTGPHDFDSKPRIGADCWRCTRALHEEKLGRTRLRRKHNALKNAKYLAWIRTLPCLAITPGLISPCCGAVQSHHVGRNGQARKNDYRAVPLCAAHHLDGVGPHAIHHLGRPRFEKKFGLRIEYWIGELNRVWEHKTNTKIPTPEAE